VPSASLQSRLQRDESIGLVVLQGFRPVGTPPPRWMMQQLNRARRSDAEELNRRMQRYVHSTFEIDGAQYRVILMPNVRSVWKFAKPVGWLFALSALVLASAWIAWMLTRPLRVMSHSTQRLAEGDLQARDGLLTSQQQLLRDVSHELRTPLARLQVALTMAQDDPHKAPDMLARAEAELGRLDNLIGQVLSLSRLQSGADTLDFEALDLLPLLESLGENAEFDCATPCGIHPTTVWSNCASPRATTSPRSASPIAVRAWTRPDCLASSRPFTGLMTRGNREGGGLVVTVCLPTLT